MQGGTESSPKTALYGQTSACRAPRFLPARNLKCNNRFQPNRQPQFPVSNPQSVGVQVQWAIWRTSSQPAFQAWLAQGSVQIPDRLGDGEYRAGPGRRVSIGKFVSRTATPWQTALRRVYLNLCCRIPLGLFEQSGGDAPSCRIVWFIEPNNSSSKALIVSTAS